MATGNLRSIAETKLHAFDLAGGLDLDVGGYGSDGGDRSELIRLARDRTNAKYGAALSPGKVVVIGDTTLDIEAARTAGTRAVGVATGSTTAGELAAAGADAVLGDLTSTEDLMLAVYGSLAGED